MSSAPTIAAGIVDQVVDVAVAHGVPREALADVLGRPDAEGRIAIDQLFAVWDVAMRRSRFVALPLRVGAAMRFDRYGVFGYALYVSRTAEQAFRRLCRYHDLLTDSGVWRMRAEPPNVALIWDRPCELGLGARVANEQVLAAFATIAEQIVAAPLPIVEVRFQHRAPEDVDEHARHFRAPLRFGADENAIVMSEAYLARRPIGSDPHLEAFFQAQIDTAIAAVAEQRSPAASVARIVLELLPDGIPTMATVARRMELGERTLRRRLAEAGQSFDELVESLQRERALALLAGTASIREIALATGFADPTAFSRAFRRWTSTSPSDYRRALH